MENLEEILTELLRGMSKLPEENMRLAFLGSRLKKLAPSDVAWLFDVFYNKPRPASAKKMHAILISPDGLKEALGSEKYEKTRIAAIEFGLRRVSRLFTDLPPHKKGVSGYDKEEELKMEMLSLGHRRALSKTNVKDALDRLLSDPDPMVITNILNNPRITEKEVLKIASKRPGSPRILKLLATHRKWSKRYAVIKAIVQNPYTLPRISVGLLDFLLTQDMEKIAIDRTLHPQVKMGAREILAERRSEKKD